MEENQAKTHEPAFVLRGHRDNVTGICFPAPHLLATGSTDGSMRLWNLKNRRIHSANASNSGLFGPKPHRGDAILSLGVLSQEGNYGHLVSSGRDGFVRVWDLSMVTSANNMTTGSSVGSSVIVCELQTGVRHFCNASTDSLQQDNYIIVTGGGVGLEGRICVWDIRCGSKPCRTLLPPPVDVSAPAANNNGAGFHESGDRGMLMSTSYLSSSFKHPASISSIEECGHGRNCHVVGGYEDGSVVCWDVGTGRVLSSTTAESDQPAMALSAWRQHPKLNNTIAQLGGEGTCGSTGTATATENERQTGDAVPGRQHIYALVGGSGSLLTRMHFSSGTNRSLDWKVRHTSAVPVGMDVHRRSGLGAVAIRHDCRLAAAGGWDGGVFLFDPGKALRPLASLRHHRDAVYCLAFDPHCPSGAGALASGSKDGTIALWSTYADVDWDMYESGANDAIDSSLSSYGVTH